MLRGGWQQPRKTSPGQSSRIPKFFPDCTGHKRENKRYYHHAERKARKAKQEQGAEQ